MSEKSTQPLSPEPQNNAAFYPLTAETAQLLRAADLTAAEWRLWSYLVTLDPFGDRYQTMPDLVEVMKECGLSKPTFYRAIAKLQEVGLFDIQPMQIDFRNLQGAKKIRSENSLKNETPVSRMRKQSQERDKILISETGVSEMRKSIAETQTPSTAAIPSDYSDYSEDLRSLSEAEIAPVENAPVEKERETNEDDPEFKDWLHKKALQLPNPPQLIEQWISKQSKVEANQREYLKSKSKATVNKVPPPPPDRFQIEFACNSALAVGDRSFILNKLHQLWLDGWHDLVEDLCLCYPDWGIMATSNGIEEAHHD